MNALPELLEDEDDELFDDEADAVVELELDDTPLPETV
jgi:hypothetical protein